MTSPRFFLFIALVFVTNGVLGCKRYSEKQASSSLTVYCAAGLRKPLEALAESYRKECGVEIRFQFGGSGTLLSQIRMAQKGDLFIAADEDTMKNARQIGCVREVLPFATQTPVIGVRLGNPKKVGALSDLFNKDIRVAIANPEAASIGKSIRAAVGGRWEEFVPKVTVMKPTVTEIAVDLSLGAVDAAIIWDSLVGQFHGIECVYTPELNARAENASTGVLGVSENPAEALKFARFISAPEKGGVMIEAAGYHPISGDVWSPKPELVLYSGGVNRPAVETLLSQFANREGVSVTTVFNGCGVLCATMKTMDAFGKSKYPDAYYACDLCFVPPVAEQFPEAILLTETEIGIAVKEGNPKKVHSIADLAQDGLRVGLCNSEQSTLGYMTRGILKSSGLWESVHKNVVVEVPTADFLVNQMKAGALDAAVVYSVNVQTTPGGLEFFPIIHPGAKAVQPFAVRKGSANSQLAGRLMEFLKSNRSEFEKVGFKWRGDDAPVQSSAIEIPPWLKEK